MVTFWMAAFWIQASWPDLGVLYISKHIRLDMAWRVVRLRGVTALYYSVALATGVSGVCIFYVIILRALEGRNMSFFLS